ncbi:MAG: alkaline phosphatase family protein [Planctomycetaceae bacterium]|jgi:predicted AlkP superfamily pyrophosphatase or phosphodiesterase|nr:alkaline phosphatase family protein [Planctomycetaceae bacterium]MDG2390324.1 alkaline phosphatase family protein [Planctomycetaceae bacterium]
MSQHVALVSLPGLRSQDLDLMPNLKALADRGGSRPLVPSFPAVTCSVQATLTTGVTPDKHGITANGFFWRDKQQVELWTAWNEIFEAPQVWDILHEKDESITSAVWFPLHIKGCGGDYICTFAPIHNPDGSESLWCYTKPTEMYGELRDTFGHFPLKHFWGPLANIKSSDWIIDSGIHGAKKLKPNFSYVYLPHLDYAAQKFGPDSEQALAAVKEIDAALERMIAGYEEALGDVTWLVASEYVITEVEGVSYPNRKLREAGFLSLDTDDDGKEVLNPGASTAWALADHQLAHVYVQNEAAIHGVAELFRNDPDVEKVLVGAERAEYNLDHPRSGEVVLISKPEKWFAYYWWLDDADAPAFAHTVDIHRKPGYDPVEMFFNMETKSTPLDATLVKGSHGYPADDPSRHGVIVSSNAGLLTDRESVADTDVTPMILSVFGY